MAGHLVLLAIKYLTINSNLLALRLPRSLYVFFFCFFFLQPSYVWSPWSTAGSKPSPELPVGCPGAKWCGGPAGFLLTPPKSEAGSVSSASQALEEPHLG